MNTLQWCHMNVIVKLASCFQADNNGCITALHHWPFVRGIHPLLVLALCEGNPPVTGGFPLHRASNADNVSMAWYHHDYDSGTPTSANVLVVVTDIKTWWISPESRMETTKPNTHFLSLTADHSGKFNGFVTHRPSNFNIPFCFEQ